VIMEKSYKIRQLKTLEQHYSVDVGQPKNCHADALANGAPAADDVYLDEDGNLRYVDPLEDLHEAQRKKNERARQKVERACLRRERRRECERLSCSSSSTDHDDHSTESSEDESSSSSDDSHEMPDLDIEAPIGMELEADYSAIEDQQMVKANTIYIYNSHKALNDALQESLPVSGILADSSTADANELSFFLVYHKKDRVSFGWYEVTFKDTEGIRHLGLWYAPMVAKESAIYPNYLKFLDIQQMAKMATLAIPLHYAIGRDHPDSLKFCVLTNWWKERSSKGSYILPGLDSSLYHCHDDTYKNIADEDSCAKI